MKRILSTIFLGMISFSLFGGARDALWKDVDAAVKKGLPKTAITNLDLIITGAMKDQAHAEAVKAIGQKIALEGNIQGNKPEEKITRMQAEIAKAPKDMAPMMQALLAHWYWHYYQQNSWRFMQRTQTATAPGKDFTTWDLKRIFAEIDAEFQKSLTAEKELKATPVTDWNDLLLKGTMPDEYRPTLYDFLAHEALSFYTAGEQAGAKPEDAFELDAKGPILDAPEKFMAWQPATPATGEPAALKAVRLYQELMRFHRADPLPRLAFADADLDRLTWGWNTAFGEDKNSRYKTALDEFIKANADFEISALAMERLAQVWCQEDEFVRAHEIAAKGSQVFPDSPGGKLCRNLLREIESKFANIVTERIWNAPWPEITVRYKNVKTVYFRAFSYDWESLFGRRYGRPEYIDQEKRKEILAQKPVLEWFAELPPTPDFKARAFAVKAPETLKPGFYFIASSHDPNFGEADNQLSITDVFVSNLSLVTRTRGGKIEGFVLEANSGEPIAGAEVTLWHMDQNGNRVKNPALATDADGFFSLKPVSQNSHGWLAVARHNGQEIVSAEDLWINGEPGENMERQRTIFFTDRAIYRPGQTVQYKGICLLVDPSKDNYQVDKGREITVLFLDVNRKEIARQKHRANDYGSISGSFTAPRDRLMGQMTICDESRQHYAAFVRVEEYKRPKFQVTLDAPKTAPKLNDKVSIPGRALAYTGAPIDGADVKYRVVRQVRMPWWWYGGWGRGDGGRGSSQEIAHGAVTTGVDGAFVIEFVAKPDPNVPEANDPTFVYEIAADVTDGAGETRSNSRSIRVGYTALEAMLSAEEWLTQETPVPVKVRTLTLDGEPVVAEGSVKIYSLKAPATVQRPRLAGEDSDQYGVPDPDLSNPNNWEQDKIVAEKGFTSDTNGWATSFFPLPAGAYRAIVETQDRFGKKVTGKLPLQVFNPVDTKFAIRIPQNVVFSKAQLQPGDELMALWGTGYDQGRAFVEIEHRNKMIQRYWTKPGQTQQQIRLAVTEAMRGGFTVHVTQVRENRGYPASRYVSVPWDNKDLDLKWEHFVSKLQPGQKETWTAVVQKSASAGGEKSDSAEKWTAEMVAALYDESLDAFANHNWMTRFNVFRQDYSQMRSVFANQIKGFQPFINTWSRNPEFVQITYRSFPPDLTMNLWRYGFSARNQRLTALPSTMAAPTPGSANLMLADALSAPAMAEGEMLTKSFSGVAGRSLPQELAKDKPGMGGGGGMAGMEPGEPGGATGAKPDLSKVAARKNLNERAFFFPQLTSDSNGVVRMTFTMPEALTRWRFLGFAHDREVRSGYLEGHAVTAKDLMVQPNPPRFLREGDAVEFTVKFSNQSDTVQRGTVRLTFTDSLTTQSADKLISNTRPEQSFDIPAKESRTVAWRIQIPDGCGFLTYKAVGATAKVSDGEEGAIPVLSRRIFVTESLPLPIRGPATKKFEFTKLAQSGSSKTLQHQNLTVQMVSNPAWYAVLALPYLMEFPYECSEQVFNRLYANALARTIANSDPKIHRVFEQWRNTPALDSPLEKNQDLKSVMLEETPWLRQAKQESEARRNVGILFDDNRLNNETERTLQKLREMQLEDGSWPWFPGGMRNEYITLYIMTGFGRMRHLGVDVDVQPAIRSLQRLDAWMTEHYNRIQEGAHPERYVPSCTDALYLYGRSFFLKDLPVAAPHQKATEFFLGQSRKFWLQTNMRQTQGHLAVALNRWGGAQNTEIARGIMASIKERSVTSEEMGMFWRDMELSWWWYHAPIETQALMIEAFDEIMQDAKTVEECKVWLLKQKQTQDWKTTKATADAVYALLLRGRELLSSDALVQVQLGGMDVTPKSGAGTGAGASKAPATSKPEAGTGFYEVRFAPADIKPKLAQITVKKVDQGVAWGSVHWQYLEDMAKMTPHEGTPLRLTKRLFTKSNTARGSVLEPVKGALKVGDELVVRIELRTDRDMEYVHMKDQRGSGTEPVNVLSRYKYQDGLAYYESTRDTASHFFIDYLPKGTYVFEYSSRVQLRGEYQTGMAEIQCMYAPEFNSHSESFPLVVK